jgi:cobalt-zinc-cadmium efflux system membrane fusion protein
MRQNRLMCTGVAVMLLAFSACGSREKIDEVAGAPPQARIVEQHPDLDLIRVEQPERFPLVTASARRETAQVHATGTVTAAIERSVPVVSLAAGRVVGIYAKLGDDVTKGQLLLKILSNDVTVGLQNYAQAKADERLTQSQLERARLLYGKGAISLNDQQVAEDSEQKAKISLETAAQQLRTLGANVDHSDPVVNVYAPQSGTIVEQNVVSASSVHTPDNQPSLFTIADLSRVWVICDVYENDLPVVRLGDSTEVRLNAYPDRIFHGKISNIGKMLDPGVRTAKVRIELRNPGLMRAGMFVTATFQGQRGTTRAEVPAGAILHLHDRDWVFLPAGPQQFRKTEITSGPTDGDAQIVLAGLAPGQQVVRDALALNAESTQ